MGRIESFMQIRWICAVAFLGTALCGGTASAGTKAAPAAKSAPAAKPTPAAKPAPAIKTSNTQRGRDATEGQHPSDNRRGGLAPTKTELQRPGDHQLPNGGKVRTDQKGVQREMDKGGHIRGIESPNMHARMGANGRPESFRVERNGSIQEFHRGPGGLRVVEGRHPAVGGGSIRVVGYGPHRGFVERPIYGRYGYMRRSYMVGGHPYAVVYRDYRYHGFGFYRPVPALIYSPGYYRWAVSPWAAPVGIQIGFVGQPWYAAYGATFAPYPVYASPDQWMTDQILATNMQQAYDAGRDAQAQQDSNAAAYAPAAPPQITPQLKAQIDSQIKVEVAEMGQAAAAGAGSLAPPATPNDPEEVPDALKPGHIAFRVVMPLSVEVDGDSCDLNSDDWILRTGDLDADGTVAVRVATSRSNECAQGSVAKVSLNDLMAMQNEQDQQIMAVLKTAAETMGKGGMPVGPASGATPVPGGQSSPDMDIAANLQKEQGDATAAESEVAATAAVGGGQ